MKLHPALCKLDSKGKTRSWFITQDGASYRTHDGILGGKIKVSGWRTAKPTNVGKANERSAEDQATSEIEADYAKKLKGAYYRDINDIHLGCRFFEPMLAQTYNDPKRAKQTAFQPGFGQPKLDGMRAIAKIDGVWSREGEPVHGTAHIMEALRPLFYLRPDLILDGELYNHDLKDDFGEIMSLAKKAKPSPERAAQIREQIQYHVYDVPSVEQTWEHRQRMLEHLFTHFGEDERTIHLVPTHPVSTVEEFDELHGVCLSAGYEGSMLRLNAHYENDRTDALLKRKDFMDAEFKLLRIELGHRGAYRAICQLDDGREFGAGIKGSRAKAAELMNEGHEVVTITFFEYTADGIPRFPIATKFHGKQRTT